MVGGVKKWKIENEEMIEKMNLYKFTHMLLLENDRQLKPKKVSNNQKKKKTQSPKFIIK